MSFLLLALVCAACGGGPQPLAAGEQINGACPATPIDLKGTKSAGSSCASANDCMPSCCSCSGSQKTYLAAACLDSKCAMMDAACVEAAKNTTFCQ
jgi:hypothetical protein